LYPSAGVVGQTISHYRITAELGAGGMGVVYRAQDLRLGRDVAIKFLPDAATHPQALERFHREARAASALNHRHICTIHEIDQHDGRPFIVMEALDGETLHARIARKRFDLPGLLDVVTQVAEGLEAAHAKGIVHRDIKPSNIFVTGGGEVKILDFGVAKLEVDCAGAGAEPSGATVTSPGALITGPGQTVGTAAYMSPEQVRGEELDARSDIFSCGVVMYEMATGTLPFQGPTSGVVFDGILNKSPAPASKTNPAMPAELDRILDKALDKDRDLRYQSARELRADLARLRRDSGSTASRSAVVEAAAGPSRLRGPALWILGAAAGLAALAVAAYMARPASGPARADGPRSLSRLTIEEGLQAQPAWSPDGRFIAYASDQAGNFDVWVQPVAGGRAVQVTNDPAADWQPSWSPDGNTLAFRSEREGGGIFVVPALGGRERRLTTFGLRPEWSPTRPELLFVVRPIAANASAVVPPIYVVGLEGGTPRRILADELSQFRNVQQVVWHPDGQRISFVAMRDPPEGLYTVPTAGGAPARSEVAADVLARLEEAEVAFRQFRWAPSGDAVYVTALVKGVYNLWRIGVDPATLKLISGPERLTTGAGNDEELSVSPDGTRLAFVTRTDALRLWGLPFDAANGRVTGDGQAITAVTSLAAFDLSADGRWLVFVLQRRGRSTFELWTRSLETGTDSMLSEAASYFSPRISSDGSLVAYRTVGPPQNALGLSWMPRTGGPERRLAAQFRNPMDWSADGTRLLHSCNPVKAAAICESPREAATPAGSRTVVQDPNHFIYQGRYSPDGRWILFNAQSMTTVGASVLGVIPASGGPWTPLSEAALWADKARWAPDGRAIYFISNRSGPFFDVWGLRFDPDAGRAVGEPFRVTRYESPGRVLDSAAGSELGVSRSHLVVPIRETKGSIWLLDGVGRPGQPGTAGR
jgi:Tol biopolymer transport system component